MQPELRCRGPASSSSTRSPGRGQPVGQHAARAAGPDDDVVERFGVFRSSLTLNTAVPIGAEQVAVVGANRNDSRLPG